MAEETNETTSFSDIFSCKLKTIDVHTLEQAISKAVSDLVGIKLECDIDQIQYGNGYSRQGAKFNVALSEPVDEMFGSLNSSAERG
jgi:hypothetical protein